MQKTILAFLIHLIPIGILLLALGGRDLVRRLWRLEPGKLLGEI